MKEPEEVRCLVVVVFCYKRSLFALFPLFLGFFASGCLVVVFGIRSCVSVFHHMCFGIPSCVFVFFHVQPEGRLLANRPNVKKQCTVGYLLILDEGGCSHKIKFNQNIYNFASR